MTKKLCSIVGCTEYTDIIYNGMALCSQHYKNVAEKSVILNQTAKADAGKTQLRLVPGQIVWDIARVREYGNNKYGDPNNWKTVEDIRFIDAAYRHWLAFIENPVSIDEESGLPHLWHLACNIAFLCEIYKGAFDGKRN